MNTSKLKQGFTLIELMIVVAIISVLASIAVPAFQGYVARTKVIEGLSLAASAKTAVSENAANGTKFDSGWVPPFPTRVVSADSTGVSRLVANSGISIDNTNGVVTITYTDIIAPDQPTLKLIPVDGANLLIPGQIIQNGLINWQCHSKTPPLNNVHRDIAGTLEEKFVPADCRA